MKLISKLPEYTTLILVQAALLIALLMAPRCFAWINTTATPTASVTVTTTPSLMIQSP